MGADASSCPIRWPLALGAAVLLLVACEDRGAPASPGGKQPAIQGVSSQGVVSGGTSARSPKYQIAYTLGESVAPQQVQVSEQHRHTAGQVGATSAEP